MKKTLIQICHIIERIHLFAVVEHVLAIAGGYNESGKLSQDWSVIMPGGRECTGIVVL